MNGEICTALREHLHNADVRFVFHSETAALLWAQFALREFALKTIARDRFTAWDVFKAENLSAHIHDKRPVTRVLRLLYARKLCEENAAAPFLHTLIPIEFSGDGLLFAKNIASILPSLKHLRRKIEERGSNALINDVHFADCAQLEIRYEAFLAEQKLFEPSWEKPPFKDAEHEYYLVYPELIEDFVEYAALLNAPNVHIINITLRDDNDSGKLLLYKTAHSELRAAALELRRLHYDEGIAYDDMALSAGALTEIEPYLTRTLQAYNVPFCMRSGKPLAVYGAGNFFAQINECANTHFSWTALQALLTNTALPWRCANKNRALLRFGVRRNCVASYRDRGRKRDIWEEAFYGLDDKKRLHNHYKKIRVKALRIVHARSFEALRRRTINFFTRFFLNKWPYETSRLLGRCLEEIAALAAFEKSYPQLIPSSPLEVLITLLNEKIHVYENVRGGVNLFDYGVAASAPCAVHLIINANQRLITKVYRPLSFLRQDKRRALGIDDADVSTAFVKSYYQRLSGGAANHIRISAARNGFSGAEIPHSYFHRLNHHDTTQHYIIDAAPPPRDAYSEEKNWWVEGGAFPAVLLPEQIKGFESWNFFYRAETFNLLQNPLPREGRAAALLNERVTRARRTEHGAQTSDGKLRVSPTALNSFFACPAQWFYKALLKLQRYDIQAQMLDAENRGLLYHQILGELFERIDGEDKVFCAEHLETYRAWTAEIAAGSAKSFKSLRGPLAAPLIGAMAASLTTNIMRMLEEEARRFDGWSVAALEKDYNVEKDGVILCGKLDRVSLSPDGIPLIVDYKTGTPPQKNRCIHSETTPLADFQIPVYIKLFEAARNIQVEYAAFFKITGAAFNFIVSPSARVHNSREDYSESINILDEFIARHAQAVRELDWTPRRVSVEDGSLNFSRQSIPVEVCPACIYKTICRMW